MCIISEGAATGLWKGMFTDQDKRLGQVEARGVALVPYILCEKRQTLVNGWVVPNIGWSGRHTYMIKPSDIVLQLSTTVFRPVEFIPVSFACTGARELRRLSPILQQCVLLVSANLGQSFKFPCGVCPVQLLIDY